MIVSFSVLKVANCCLVTKNKINDIRKIQNITEGYFCHSYLFKANSLGIKRDNKNGEKDF